MVSYVNTITSSLFFSLALLLACKSSLIKGNRSPQAVYGEKLQKAGLGESAMVSSWFAAAEKSLRAQLLVELPFSEKGFFSPDKPTAYDYRIESMKGQKIEVNVSARSLHSGKIFIELWAPSKNGTSFDLLQFADSIGKIVYEPDKNVSLILRIQAELLSPISYELTIIAGPSLAFPVRGGSNKNIGSIWGDVRDAGARNHEGIDIFGKKGTPVIAAAEGRILSVRNGGLGGKTIFLRPTGKDISLYYAHLDSQLVEPGQKVNTGDTIGLLGNTGNARNTPPHLHFGIYGNEGALDPLIYVRQETKEPARITGKENLFGQAARTLSNTILFNSTHSRTNSRSLTKNTYVLIQAATGNHYKVLLPDGSEGFLTVNAVSSFDRPITTLYRPSPTLLLYLPVAGSAVTGYTNSSSLPVNAYFNDHAFVITDSARGWINLKQQ